jgi:hypothetical protein
LQHDGRQRFVALVYGTNWLTSAGGARQIVVAFAHVNPTPNRRLRMALISQNIPTDLMSTNEEFRKLAQEHSRYEEQLHQLTLQPYLSSEDLLLEAQLKKLKLRLKDQMQQLISRRRREQPRA